jgi:hypothetical protein
MDRNEIAPLPFDLSDHRFGAPQHSGTMSVLPMFGQGRGSREFSPLSRVKLSGVEGYGEVKMTNSSENDGGVAIVPLHLGYIQDRAQNHALCRSAFIAPGQKLIFRDACCVQESQGGYLQAADQWFFILPLSLREQALKLRRVEDYSKLWRSIAQLNGEMGLSERGHLEQVICRQRPYLTQYASRFELLSGQTGAMFFLRGRLVGVEIAPNSRYFAELWSALVCFCYGVAAMREDHQDAESDSAPEHPFAATTLEELKQELAESRRARTRQLVQVLTDMPSDRFQLQEEERFLDLRLKTAVGRNFAGQVVQEDGQLVYASIFARRHFLLN